MVMKANLEIASMLTASPQLRTNERPRHILAHFKKIVGAKGIKMKNKAFCTRASTQWLVNQPNQTRDIEVVAETDARGARSLE
jgi:hypothetical protein